MQKYILKSFIQLSFSDFGISVVTSLVLFSVRRFACVKAQTLNLAQTAVALLLLLTTITSTLLKSSTPQVSKLFRTMRHPTYAFAQLTKCREPCTIAPDVDTVPNEKERLGFRRLLYDRQRSFMTMELVRVRDALIGSNALIVKARVDPNPDMLDNVIAPAMLSLNGSQGFDSPDGLLRLLINYVGDAAYGDSALRWSDGLPPTATFAHGQVLLACTCEGKLDYNQDAIIDAIKSQHQLDWKPYLAYMETQRAIGRITANSAGELRLRLQRTLETLNDDFLEAVERQLCRSGFPYQEIGMLEVEAEIRQLVEKVEGLPEAMTNAVSVGDPFNYSVSQLEELRKRGKVVRESIVQLRREQGETLLARAASLSGKEAEEAMDEAEIKLFSVMKSSGFDSAEAHVRLSKLYMKQNK